VVKGRECHLPGFSPNVKEEEDCVPSMSAGVARVCGWSKLLKNVGSFSAIDVSMHFNWSSIVEDWAGVEMLAAVPLPSFAISSDDAGGGIGEQIVNRRRSWGSPRSQLRLYQRYTEKWLRNCMNAQATEQNWLIFIAVAAIFNFKSPQRSFVL